MATTMQPFDLSKLSQARKARFGQDEALDEKLPWPQFTVADLNFYYGNFQALHNLNLIVPTNRVTGLIGPSGCGKSTFLRTLNRMYESIPGTRLTGTLRLGENDLFQYSPTSLRRRVGMVFQKPSPFPKSIYDNIAFGIRVNNMAKKVELADLVEQSLRRAALWDEVKDKLHESAFSLSGGQQQRLCIARALASNLKCFCLMSPVRHSIRLRQQRSRI